MLNNLFILYKHIFLLQIKNNMKKKLETRLAQIQAKMEKLQYEALYYLREDWKQLRQQELMIIEFLEN